MEKKIIISVFVLGAMVLPAVAFGALPTTLTQLGGLVISAIYTVFIVIATCCFLLAGILFATGQGDPQKISLARAAVIWGVVGAVVGILSASVLPILLTWLG